MQEMTELHAAYALKEMYSRAHMYSEDGSEDKDWAKLGIEACFKVIKEIEARLGIREEEENANERNS